MHDKLALGHQLKFPFLPSQLQGHYLGETSPPKAKKKNEVASKDKALAEEDSEGPTDSDDDLMPISRLNKAKITSSSSTALTSVLEPYTLLPVKELIIGTIQSIQT